jgi:hypothetical protein
MTEYRMVLPDDRDGWLRLIDGTDCVVATEFISGPVAELVANLAPGDVVTVLNDVLDGDQNGGNRQNDHNPHRCDGPELWTSRMQLALLSDDMVAYDVVTTQVGDCDRCWRAIAHWTSNLLAGDRAVRAGGNAVAATYVLREIARLTSHG